MTKRTRHSVILLRIICSIRKTNQLILKRGGGGATQKLKICNFVDIHLTYVSHY